MKVINIRTENKLPAGGVESSVRTALLVSKGPKWMQVIWPDSAGIAINKVPVEYTFTELADYPIEKAKRALRRMGRNFGITKAARKALQS